MPSSVERKSESLGMRSLNRQHNGKGKNRQVARQTRRRRHRPRRRFLPLLRQSQNKGTARPRGEVEVSDGMKAAPKDERMAVASVAVNRHLVQSVLRRVHRPCRDRKRVELAGRNLAVDGTKKRPAVEESVLLCRRPCWKGKHCWMQSKNQGRTESGPSW